MRVFPRNDGVTNNFKKDHSDGKRGIIVAQKPQTSCNVRKWLWLKFFLFKAWRKHLISFRTCVFWNPHLTNPSKQKAVVLHYEQSHSRSIVFSSLRAAFCLSCFAIFFVHCFFSNFSNSHVLCSWAVVSHFLLCSILWWSPPFWVLPLVLHLFPSLLPPFLGLFSISSFVLSFSLIGEETAPESFLQQFAFCMSFRNE